MTDKELIQNLNSIVGQSIVDVSYIQTKFHYSNSNDITQGDWTKVNPELFLLHSPEWNLKLSSGQTIFISGQRLSEDNFASKFYISNSSKATQEENVLDIPRVFNWLDILNKPISKFRLWQRITKSSKLLGHEYNFKYQDHFQIIDLLCGDKTLSLSTMDGDIGDMSFYPTGYLGEKIGIFFNKTVCSSYTVHDLTMRMSVTYKSK